MKERWPSRSAKQPREAGAVCGFAWYLGVDGRTIFACQNIQKGSYSFSRSRREVGGIGRERLLRESLIDRSLVPNVHAIAVSDGLWSGEGSVLYFNQERRANRPCRPLESGCLALLTC